MPNAYQQSILSLRYAPLKRTAETEERVLTALQTAADQLKRLIGNTDSPLTKKFYNRRRLQVAALMNQLAIGLKKDISDQVQAIADEVAAIMQEETNDLLQENLRADVVADFTQVPREVLNWSADRQDREGLKLSASIWADNQTNQIESVLLAGMARGESARDLSLKLEQFILGGGQGLGDSVRSKAMRLARTEINNSYWEARRMSSELSPVVEGIKWELSAQHPEWDVCDYLSKQDLYGLGPGVYPPELLPPKPHPNCLCYSVDTLRDVEAWDDPRDVPELQEQPSDVPLGRRANGFTENYIKRQHDLFVQSVEATEAAYRGQAPTPTPTTEPAPATFGDSIRREISQGLTSEQDYIRIGAMVRAEMAVEYEAIIKRPREVMTPGEFQSAYTLAWLIEGRKKWVKGAIIDGKKVKPGDRIEHLYKGIARIVDEWEPGYGEPPQRVLGLVKARLQEIERQEGRPVLSMKDVDELVQLINKERAMGAPEGKTRTEPELAQLVKDTLSQVRPMGRQGQDIKYAPGSNKQARELADEAAELIPTEWVNNSNNNALELWASKTTSRAHYRHGYRRRVKGQYLVVGEYKVEPGTYNATSTALHEMGHRIEYTTVGVQDIEEEFYQRRTKGESLQWLGGNYGRSERTRRDDFTHPYMGKSYGGDAWEILSMGLEGVFYGNYELYEKDQDYFDLILGILAAH